MEYRAPRSGEYDPDHAQHLDRFLAMCRQNGIYVKMCIEYFRNIPAQRRNWSDKPLHHTANGGPFADMKDFLTSERGIAQFKRKLAWYARRYGDEPAVFAWELWNEMNCVAGDWRPWTKIMLAELHRLFPKNLAVQSLGSFDGKWASEPYRELCPMEGNDVAQVHRYLDPGAEFNICHGPVDLLAADAVAEMKSFQVRKPIILTETGAVKPKHTGASELYAKDTKGTLLHDMLFAPFFCGAAGTGHVWWWPQAIDRPNLWHHFARFARAVEGIDPAGEKFEAVTILVDPLRIYALKGRRTTLAWCRDSRCTWETELRDGVKPPAVSGCAITGKELGLALEGAAVRYYDPWTGAWSDGKVAEGRVTLPDFRRSMVVRMDMPTR